MVRHPMQKCPAEFVPVFREILENSDWESENPSHICHSIGRHYDRGDINRFQYGEMIGWIRECLDGFYSFGGWMLSTYPDYKHLIQENQCRKAWLEWLVSPEGHE